MIVPCEVLEEVSEDFIRKRGPKTIRLWLCLDRTSGGALRSTFDYEVNADEQERFSGKVVGGFVELVVTEIRVSFGGRVRFRGTVYKFAGEEVPC
jgi:hypothetical protein